MDGEWDLDDSSWLSDLLDTDELPVDSISLCAVAATSAAMLGEDPVTAAAMDQKRLLERPPARARTRPVSINPARNRKRAELLYLRDLVQQLEGRLASLRQRPSVDDSDAPAQRRACKQQVERARVWHDLAMRQSEQRQLAELHNRKLHRMLQDQLKLARNLQRLLKRSVVVDPEVLVATEACAPGPDEVVFQRLRDKLVELYRTLDIVMSDARYSKADGKLRDVQVRMDHTSGTTVEILESKSLPFDLARTANAVWQQATDHAIHDKTTEVCDDGDLSADFTQKEFTVEMELGPRRGCFRGKLAARRVVEADRVVVLWTSQVEPVEIGGTKMDGLVLSHNGWVVLRALPAEATTLLQSHFQLSVPPQASLMTDTQDRVGLLTDFALSAVTLQHHNSQHMVEHLMFEAALPLDLSK